MLAVAQFTQDEVVAEAAVMVVEVVILVDDTLGEASHLTKVVPNDSEVSEPYFVFVVHDM